MHCHYSYCTHNFREIFFPLKELLRNRGVANILIACSDNLKGVYGAINTEQAEKALVHMEDQWGKLYPAALRSWLQNWQELSAYFDFPPEIRRIIYTTNAIESVNRNIRKFTKNKVLFPDDQSVMKAVFLAVQQIASKWTACVPNWPLIAQQFEIIYPNRAKINIFNPNYR